MVIALASAFGCGGLANSPAPTQSTARASTSVAPGTTRTSRPPSASPHLPLVTTTSPSPAWTTGPSLAVSAEPFAATVHVISGPPTRKAAWVRSVGNEIVWVSGSNDLYRYVPGATSPEHVYTAPEGSYIPKFAASSAGYAIVAQDWIEGFDPPTHWQLWYLDRLDGDAVLIDQVTTERTLDIPDISMDSKRIAWISHHEADAEIVSELRVAEIDDLAHPRTLSTYPYWDFVIADPALNGDELWYGISVSDWNADTSTPRVEMIDLRRPEVSPQVYGESERAFMPAANDEVVVWKGGLDPSFAADNWGSIYIYWRADGTLEQLPSINRAMYPSVGDRFVAWQDGHYQLYLYDLKERTTHLIEPYDPYGGSFLEASVAGSLLAYPFKDGIRWAILPE